MTRRLPSIPFRSASTSSSSSSSSSSAGAGPSIWQAPQSRSPVPRPRPEVTEAQPSSSAIPLDRRSRADVYKRRITRPDLSPEGPPPAPWQRWSQLLGGALSAGAGLYFVLWADYGPKEHCFSPLRRMLGLPNSKTGDAKMAKGGPGGKMFGCWDVGGAGMREKKTLATVLEEERVRMEGGEGQMGETREKGDVVAPPKAAPAASLR